MKTEKLKHTPGPWQFNETGFKGSSNFLVKNDSGQLYIADVNSWSTDAETLANVRLIAAAPELLEALELLVPHASSYIKADSGNPDKDQIIKFAKEAIKKATE